VSTRVLGVVLARGGSKGIPRKNVALLAGKPLLAYTATAALRAKRLSTVILSTEDEEIAAIGRRLGLDVPFMRPRDLAQDDTLGIQVIQHAIREMEALGERFDAVFTLQPTNPLRRAEDIDGAIELFERTGADSVISFVEVGDNHPARMKFLDPQGRVVDPPFGELVEGQRRQDLPKLYLREGSVYLTRRDVLVNEHSFKGRDCRAWMIPADRACNIDEPVDWIVAEALVRHHGLA
jgi:CMP-N,N'-diacetyllegionaminic acid synthase